MNCLTWLNRDRFSGSWRRSQGHRVGLVRGNISNERTNGGQIRYWLKLAADGSWRVLFGIYVGGEKFKTPKEQLDIWVRPEIAVQFAGRTSDDVLGELRKLKIVNETTTLIVLRLKDQSDVSAVYTLLQRWIALSRAAVCAWLRLHAFAHGYHRSSCVARCAMQVRAALDGNKLASLVNNPGISLVGPMLHQPIADIGSQLDVNLIGQAIVTQAFAPLLGADRSLTGKPGRIANLSSVGRKFGGPFLGAYAPSKHGLERMSESLHRELLLYGTDVILI